jgi:hypothetical protein
MAENKARGSLDFHAAGRRYAAPAQRESRASGLLGPGPGWRGDSFRKALADISSEDEAYPTLEDQGPIVFRDGVFQIEIKAGTGDSALDPALKGLIDSILEPKSRSTAPEEKR